MNNSRAIIIIIVIVVFFLTLIYKLFDVQIIKSEELRYYAERQQMKREKIIPERGLIYDGNKTLLVCNKNDVTLYLDLRMLSEGNKEKIAKKFSSVFGKSVNHYFNLMDHTPATIPFEKKVPGEKALLLKNFKVPGLFYREDPTRVYHYKNLASHLLGYLNADYSGVNGVEKSFNDLLKGEEGIRLVERNAIGDVITFSEEETRRAVAGNNIYLTVKRSFQTVLEEELKSGITEFSASSALGIIMDPNTGEILALANISDYDPNRFWDFSDDIRRNRVITDIYEPGSTFKSFTLAALLDQKLCGEYEIVNVENGRYKFRNANISDTHKFEHLTVKGVIEQSSNIGISKLSQRIDDELFYKYLRSFGFGNYTAINLPGEVKGNLKKPSHWSALTKAFMSFGYEISVTPIQLVTAYSAIVNGGVLFKPQIVKKITNSNGELIVNNESTEIRRVISEETSLRMRSLLKGVVENGTGKSAKTEYVSIGGKTGTSKRMVKGTYVNDYNSSFVGFFPVESPQIVCLILVNSPKVGKYGGLVAAPIFKKVADKLIELEPNLIGQPKDLPSVNQDYDFVSTSNYSDENQVNHIIRNPAGIQKYNSKTTIMPELKDYSLRDAIMILTRMQMKYKVSGSGVVVSQSIEPGDKIKKGSTCVLECKEVTVPGTTVY
jgi:cell division protein FtsI (penicillin-binding protein 3)